MGTLSFSAARSSSCAVTRRVPSSMVEMVCLSLNPSNRATSFYDNPRVCLKTLILLPMRSLATTSSPVSILAYGAMQALYALVD